MLKNIQILEGNKKEHYIVHFLQKYFFGCFSSICSILREKNEHVKYLSILVCAVNMLLIYDLLACYFLRFPL